MNRPQYEKSDLKVRPIAIFAIGLTVMIGLSLGSSRLLLRYLTRKPAPTNSTVSVLPPQATLPSEPRLQSNPHKDLLELEAKEENILTNYEWVDRAKGLVRIPIDRAMDLVLSDGFPSRKPSEGKDK